MNEMIKQIELFNINREPRKSDADTLEGIREIKDLNLFLGGKKNLKIKEDIFIKLAICCNEYDEYAEKEILIRSKAYHNAYFDTTSSKDTNKNKLAPELKKLDSETLMNLSTGFIALNIALNFQNFPNAFTNLLDKKTTMCFKKNSANFLNWSARLRKLSISAKYEEVKDLKKITKKIIKKKVKGVTEDKNYSKESNKILKKIFLSTIFKIHSDFFYPPSGLNAYLIKRKYILHKAQFASCILYILPGKTMRFSIKDLDESVDDDDWCRLSEASKLFTNKYHLKSA